MREHHKSVSLKKNESEEEFKQLNQKSNSNPNSISIPKIELNKLSPHSNASKILFEHSPQTFAQEFTFIDLSFLSQIGVNEITRCSWAKKTSPPTSPNILSSTTFFNNVKIFFLSSFFF